MNALFYSTPVFKVKIAHLITHNSFLSSSTCLWKNTFVNHPLHDDIQKANEATRPHFQHNTLWNSRQFNRLIFMHSLCWWVLVQRTSQAACRSVQKPLLLHHKYHHGVLWFAPRATGGLCMCICSLLRMLEEKPSADKAGMSKKAAFDRLVSVEEVTLPHLLPLCHIYGSAAGELDNNRGSLWLPRVPSTRVYREGRRKRTCLFMGFICIPVNALHALSFMRSRRSLKIVTVRGSLPLNLVIGLYVVPGSF